MNLLASMVQNQMSPTSTPAPTSSVISSTRGHALPKKILRLQKNLQKNLTTNTLKARQY
jgi:hypothetical protein